MNINDVVVPIHKRFSDFYYQKTYSLVLYDFNHPQIQTTSVHDDGRTTYVYMWRAMSETEYVEEGVAENVWYTQQIGKEMFDYAYGHWRFSRNDQWRRLRPYKDSIITVRMTFKRTTRKRLDITSIELLKSHDPEPDEDDMFQ